MTHLRSICKNLFLVMILSQSIAFGQTNKTLFKYGQDAFKNKNYSNAAFFFMQYLDKISAGSSEIVYPYAFITRTKDNKEHKTDSLIANDSIRTDNHKIKGKLNKNHQEALYLLAKSYHFSHNYVKAEQTFKICKKLDLELYPHVQYWYGVTLISNMKYDKAQIELEGYITNRNKTPDSLAIVYLNRAEKLLINSRWAKEAASRPVKGVEIKKPDTLLNASTSQFSAAYIEDEKSILFSSLKENNTYDIFTARVKDSSIWSNIKPFSNNINSVYHDGTPCMSKDGTKLFFTRWQKAYGTMECSIYLSRFFNGQWVQPQKLGENVNKTGYNSMDPFLSDDGTLLYFSSNRPNGKGLLDIWYCTIDEYGNASPPINLGDSINTTEDDRSPYYSESTQSLFFSSKGHLGMGGFDVFQSFGTISNYLPTENLGFPINSGRDDLHFVLNQIGNYGMFTSDRNDCFDCKSETACFSIFEVDYGPPKFTLSGHVYSRLDKKPISNALISFKDINGFIEPFFIITDENGYYFTPLRRETSYNVKAQKVRYFADAADITTVGLDKSKDLVHDFYLPLIPVGEIEIKGIYYDYDKWDLRDQSKTTLDSLIYFLNINNNIVIELGSHTDSRGIDSYNMKLSQKRAQSVVDYLIDKGIPGGRLKPKGYGESRPKVINAETEDEHQKNRRTAFKVIGEDFVPLKK